MTIENLLRGLKENYPSALHPSEIAEQDMRRTLKAMGWNSEQLEKLYAELLASCEYFPKIFDMHYCANKLHLERKETSRVTKTREQFRKWESERGEALTLHEWLWEHGGYEQMGEDCQWDMVKLRKLLRIMGVLEIPEAKLAERRGKHERDLSWIGDDLPLDTLAEL